MNERSEQPPSPRLELVLAGLFLTTGALAVGFVLVYAIQGVPHATQFLGLSLGLAFISLAAALLVIARRFVVSEEVEDAYPPDEHPEDEQQLESLVADSAGRFTRRRVLGASAGIAGAALATALIAPVVSLGPVFDLGQFTQTPWRRGLGLVGEDGHPLVLDEIEEADFYTAYPTGADREQLGAPLVLVRLPVSALHLPLGRQGWAPHGVVAYSKICTHAGCAISLYRTPTFPETEPGLALVCPCHYSSFDPATGGTVIFGPAGRPLPQLPLELGPAGELRAAGNFSGPVGPSWWGVRSRDAR